MSESDQFAGNALCLDQSTWNPQVGLWTQPRPGHTRAVSDIPRVHSGPEAVMKLLTIAQHHQLGQIDVDAILAALADTQIRDNSPQHGAFKWYYEEDHVDDDHASFFICMGLLALWHCHRDQLNHTQQIAMQQLLVDGCHHCVDRVNDGRVFYPNEYLGYAISAYLAIDFFELKDRYPELPGCLEAAFDFLLDNGWGWGEHLSTIYGSVLLSELSMLLLFARDLPQTLRRKSEKLIVELLEIEDFFAGGPRVPTIRDYSFLTIPQRFVYTRLIAPIPEDVTYEPYVAAGERLPVCDAPFLTATGKVWYPLGDSLYRHGWHEMAQRLLNEQGPPPHQHYTGEQSRFRVTQCYDDIVAHSYGRDDTLLGSLSRFPVNPTVEHRHCGLALACFPVALWVESDLWTYPQWETCENDRVRYHPAERKYEAYLHNALSDAILPPMVGYTWCLQKGPEVICLRVMPQISAAWQSLKDRFRIVSPNLQVCDCQNHNHWSILKLRSAKQKFVLCQTAPPGWMTPPPKLEDSHKGILDWAVTYTPEELSTRALTASLWLLSLEDCIPSGPQFPGIRPMHHVPPRTEDSQCEMTWKTALNDWHIRIDLTKRNPLRNHS